MSRKIKGLMEKDLKSFFEGVDDCMVVSVRGIGGTDSNCLRGQLLEKDIHLKVVKNSLARRAFSDLGKEGIKDLLSGACTVAYGGESIVDLAKALVDLRKQYELLEVKGAYLEGEILDAESAKALSKMPTRAELQGKVVSAAFAPGSNLVGALTSPAGTIAGCLKSLIENKEGETEAA